jgi:hypothetical protein
MKKQILLFILLFPSLIFSQIKGFVADENGNPLSNVNIYVKDTYSNTTTNDKGIFTINFKKEGTYTILFQYIGYKTHKEVIVYNNASQNIEVKLYKEEYQLDDVVIKKGQNPAIEIIKKAIANRKENSKKTTQYQCDFYSRGIFRVKNLPKKFMGQKVDMFDEIIDSTRSGILYLSETVSKIAFQKPNKMKETIVASKVSGKDNGFSFNNAADVNFDFYENYIPFNLNVVSPIADNAFNYYNFKFEGSFYDENNLQINKIQVISKRNNEPSFNGYIYIVDDSWAIYAVDVNIKGNQIQQEALNTLSLKQNFSYNSLLKVWIKNTQTIDFEAGIFSFNFNGKFTYGYSNFEFPEQFEKKTFTAEVLHFEENANKKDDTFWNSIRPVPLTEEENNDYLKKDALQLKHKSKTYLDSIDDKRNKFKFGDILGGYTYRNSFKKWSISYESPITSVAFNTVQGWKLKAGLNYTKYNEETRKFTRISSNFDYGFSEQKLRVSGGFYSRLSNKTNSFISVNGGSSITQFNTSNPISSLVNTVSTLFFKNNFMKLYEKNFVSASYGKEWFNGFYLTTYADYAERKPLFDTTDYAVIKSTDVYSSNNPLLAADFVTPVFQKYNIAKLGFTAKINFAQKYWTRPDGKFNVENDKFPVLYLGYEKAFLGSQKQQEYDLISGRVTYGVTLGNKGNLQMNIKSGKFFNAQNIAFPDYKHFNGNQTHIGQSDNYLNVFNLMPYYKNSTNNAYFEAHFEHNDKGYIMNKIPLLNLLKSQMVLGFHNLATTNNNPYQEFSIGLDNLGFGKFKMFRIDYVRSYQNGFQGDGVVFGLKFLNIVE